MNPVYYTESSSHHHCKHHCFKSEMTRHLTLSRWSPLHWHFGIRPVHRMVPHSYSFCCIWYGWLEFMFKFFYTFLYQVTYVYSPLPTSGCPYHCDFLTCRLTPHMPYIAIHVYIFCIYIVLEVFNTQSPTVLKRANISWPCVTNAQVHFSANSNGFCISDHNNSAVLGSINNCRARILLCIGIVYKDCKMRQKQINNTSNSLIILHKCTKWCPSYDYRRDMNSSI
jgi:hypothetical protein